MVEKGDKHFKLQSERVDVQIAEVREIAIGTFKACGCDTDEAVEVTDHLIEADRSSVEPHGVIRVLQYAREYQHGLFTPGATVDCAEHSVNSLRIDANGGIGIRAMRAAVDAATERARLHGLAMATLIGAGHTGRLVAFAEEAAHRGCMVIILGGGNRKRWRVVAPHGGRQALLPTNP